MKLGRLALVFTLALTGAVGAPSARAVVWPDVAERIERDLTAPDVATRRAAARALPSLSRKRGGPMALAALQDTDDDVRLSAADAAIRLRAAGATEGVITWLNGSDARIRRKACEVARALPSPAAIGPLARSLGDLDPEVRGAAAAALGRQASPEAVAPLLGRLDDAAPAVRVKIVEALAALGDTRAVVPLVSKIQDSSPEVRLAVARTLGELGDPRASPALVLALRDTSNDVRREAIVAMGRMRSADAVDALAPLLSDRVQALRMAAFEALGAIATRDAVRLLVGALGKADDASPTLDRTPARSALAAAGQAAIAPLGELLRSGAASPATAASAAWVLGALHAHEQADTLVDAMRRGVLPAVAAMHALAGAGTEASIPVVLEYVDDPAAVVRDEALGAALALLDPARADGRAVEPLTAALRDPHLTAPGRLRAVALLGRTGASRAAPFLVGLASSSDESLRLAAIDALASLGPSASAADDVLLGALDAPDARLRLHAAVALGETASVAAIAPLLAKLDGASEIDRASVLTALAGVAARMPAPAVVDHVRAYLRISAGAERDALIEVLGLSALPRAIDGLAALGSSPTVEDRRTVATLCAAHPADARAVSLARHLLSDFDEATRAEAAWALGSIGESADVARLVPLLRGDGTAVAADAASAIGRIAARTGRPGDATASLCAAVGDSRPLVRSDALAGLALSHARCEGGAVERDALADDSSEQVRTSAARAVSVAPADADRVALARCARQDASVRVALACSAAPAATVTRTRRTRVYVVPEGADAPRPLAPYALVYGDGTVRMGLADRRGAVVDPVAPDAPDVPMRLTTAGE